MADKKSKDLLERNLSVVGVGLMIRAIQLQVCLLSFFFDVALAFFT